MLRLPAVALAALLSLCAAAVQAAEGGLEAALAEAKAKQVPVLLDFHAPWCYSCYFMKKNVLTGAEWAQVQRNSVVLSVDADSPEGAALKERYAVKALPSYVVLNAAGEELGRISAERTRLQFYPELNSITRRNTTLDELRTRAAAGRKGSLAATRTVLAAHLARREGQAGLDWFATLPEPVRQTATADLTAQRTLARLELRAAADARRPEACLVAAEKALVGGMADGLDCESAYDLDVVLDCSVAAPAERRQAFLKAQAPRFDAFLIRTVLSPRQNCADVRSAVFAVADLHEALGDQPAKAATFQKGIAYFEPKIAKRFTADRNAADNLRVLYEAAGANAKFDALLQKLVVAYPEDYVYANRYARVLAARGEHDKALSFFAQAAEKAYGINRLKNAQGRVQSLMALQRAEEARAVAGEALKANGPWFPEEMAKLKALLPQA